MVREAFMEKRWRAQDLALVQHINDLLESFRAEGVEQATLRTVYYGLVKQNLIPNKIEAYNQIKRIVGDARLCGLIDWESIVDLGRQTIMPSEWNGLGELVESAIASYRLPRWEGQKNYVEVWVEKEGMTVSIRPVTENWHVRLMPNKGYGSITALYDGSKRLLRAQEAGLNCYILYLGDHDPSGLDMDRDIADRLRMLGVPDVKVERIALTTAQVREYDPPKNPAKFTDSRATAYVAQFGRHSWEVNALSPATVNRLIEKRLKKLVDKPLMDAVIERENEHKAMLRRVAEGVESDG